MVQTDALLLQNEPLLDLDLLGISELGVIPGRDKVLSASHWLPVSVLLALKSVLSMLQ